ncbi:hypothetical protein A1O1_08544 [Capronia coronata CBS 617.96]|uniref:GAR domain-containing protein n=1 Tax=Capronia coronata CBS 617.96 TaxID=1182541 RepID=W9XSV2_9EURO|nr:uncharacterized protein A1O1_08544 [Capronia coronata CBS 617.96]EXJ80400.1 hypothetical protein A1O1_08544 [Capronia coronata CBS 617.96]
MAVSTPTRPHFPRFHLPIDSRSPSRSPRRKPQFAIKELDPLLGNLSPDSTLKALQATELIPGGSAQDALTSSIRDATPAERETGIRAAFVAQKIRGWRTELSQWSWPGRRERTLGLGFIAPRAARETDSEYRGFLPVALAEQYDARLEEIRDDLDSLGIEDIKEHVLEAHVPSTSSPASPDHSAVRASYGRMRDFTALITATVIQALPDLAKLNVLLDTWEIRLRVLRSLPAFLTTMESTQREIEEAFKEIRQSASARDFVATSFENWKLALGGRVSDMGRWVDRFLDMLEGHEDSLPQTWIDKLEKTELDYAAWVVEAQNMVLQNELAAKTDSKSSVTQETSIELRTGELSPGRVVREEPTAFQPGGLELPSDSNLKRTKSQSSVVAEEESHRESKPSLKLDMSSHRGHKREMSKVSVADSTFSTFSDISNAEIMDARTTSVLPSPKVSVVDNPFRTSRDELTWFGDSSTAQHQMTSRPPVLQRASTASIEVIPKDQLREVMLRRTVSWDMLSRIPSSPESTPTKALKQLTGSESPEAKKPIAELEASYPAQYSPVRSVDTSPLATPSLQVEPLHISNRDHHRSASVLPSVPRRSSKRNTTNRSSLSSRKPVSSQVMGLKEDNQESPRQKLSTAPSQASFPGPPRRGESLDEKIQDILTTLPNKIQLTKDGESSSSVQPSISSTRSSTPAPSLTLSAVMADSSGRKSNATDPEISLYHLTRTGQARDAPPMKLFVRTVGDGHRVMVRVGGGWADLGEYLKEYSLHHGTRATVDGRLEVASFPGSGQKDSATTAGGNGVSGPYGRRKAVSPSTTQTAFGTTASPELVNSKRRTSLSRPRSPEAGRKTPKNDGTWTPPPVPPIPPSYTTPSPTLTTATQFDKDAVATSVVEQDRNPPTVHSRHSSGAARWPSNMRSISISSSGVTTTTVVTPPVTTSSYTPLGAAGPKMNARRAATFGATTTPGNEAWVEGMVGKARAVSGASPASIRSPTTTTTTTTTTSISSSTPTTRRVSYFGSSPSSNSSPLTVSSSPSTGSVASDAKSHRSSLSIRSKTRMSLSDMSGIKRVFLRKKSDHVR